MPVNKYLMPVATLLALLGTIFTAKIAGYWQTSGREMIDPAQPLSSADIRGWMPLDYLSERLGISHETLYHQLGIPNSTPPQTPLKELEDVIEVSEVRAVIAEYLGETASEQDAEQTHNEATPTATVAPATPTPPQTETEHQPGSGQGTGDGTGLGPTPLPAGQILPAAEIKGRMTLQEVSEQCGIPLDVLYSELELESSTSPTTQLKTLTEQIAGFEVSQVRDVVATYQNE